MSVAFLIVVRAFLVERIAEVWKQRATWESKVEVQDDSKHIAEADQATRKLGHTISDMNVDTHLSDKEVNTDALVKDEAVTEELTDTNTKAIEGIKIGSNKLCIREDLARERMVSRQESSQAFFEVSNLELIELKTSMIQCPSCLHNVFNNSLPMRGSTSDPTWI